MTLNCLFHRYEGAFDPWLVSLWSKLNQVKPAILPRVSDIQDAQVKTLDAPKFQISYRCVAEPQQHFPTTPGNSSLINLLKHGSLSLCRYCSGSSFSSHVSMHNYQKARENFWIVLFL